MVRGGVAAARGCRVGFRSGFGGPQRRRRRGGRASVSGNWWVVKVKFQKSKNLKTANLYLLFFLDGRIIDFNPGKLGINVDLSIFVVHVFNW